MSTTSTQPVAPIALQPGEGDARWFLGALGTIKAAPETTGGELAVIEFLWPHGGGSPLHVHHDEDEWFYVIEGEVTFWVGGETIVAPAGSFVYGPRDVPHTFVITSAVARFLMVTDPAPSQTSSAPDRCRPRRSRSRPRLPTCRRPEELTAIAAEYGIEVIGPPGIPA